MNVREIREIFRLVEKTDFSGVEIVQGDIRIRIERGGSPQIQSLGAVPARDLALPAPSLNESRPVELTGKRPSKKEEEGTFVTSPFVGTFYRTPSPDSPPYVEVGQTIRKGQPLCIVEAMKLMNEIESDFDGKIVEIRVENGQPVEYGERLFRIEPM